MVTWHLSQLCNKALSADATPCDRLKTPENKITILKYFVNHASGAVQNFKWHKAVATRGLIDHDAGATFPLVDGKMTNFILEFKAQGNPLHF